MRRIWQMNMTGGQALVQSALPGRGAGDLRLCPACSSITPLTRYTKSRESATSRRAMSKPPPTWPTAYARVSGRVGTAMVVPGPGLFNAAAGIATAHAVSSPLLIVTRGCSQRHTAR